MLKILMNILLLLAFLVSEPCMSSDTNRVEALYPKIDLIGTISPKLTDTEKRLVCGESQKEKASNEAWAEIPFPQAQYQLKLYLQDRGYHNPRFTKIGPNLERMLVDIGEKTIVREVKVLGDADPVQFQRKRDIVGEVLTPELLNRLEKWVISELGKYGYACPKVTSHADPKSGEITLDMVRGPLLNVASISQEKIPNAHDDLLRRYDPFKLGDLYSGTLLTLSASRVANEQIVESTYFTKTCRDQGVHLQQFVVAGLPRILTFGFGANTEGFLLGKVSWRNVRLGEFGSSIDFSAFGSARLQNVEAKSKWYFLPYVSRFYFAPLLQINRREEIHFEFISTRAQFGPTTSVDFLSNSLTTFLGPTFDYYHTLRGFGAPDTSLLSLESKTTLASHEFEYYALNPQAGFQITFTLDLADRKVFSRTTAHRFNLRGEKLWNIHLLDPPRWIIGLRGGFTTVISGELGRFDSGLPASYLQYLGGSMDLRGFGRQELPSGDNPGGLTSGFIGLEGRLSKTLPFNIDPFVFVDGGALGSGSFAFDSNLFWSPGMGIRWASPFGPVRMTFAHGYTGMTPNHFQFYLSFGEEF